MTEFVVHTHPCPVQGAQRHKTSESDLVTPAQLVLCSREEVSGYHSFFGKESAMYTQLH